MTCSDWPMKHLNGGDLSQGFLLHRSEALISLVPFLDCSPQQTVSGLRELTTYNTQIRLTELFGCLQIAGSISSGSEIPLYLLSLLLLSLFLSFCIIAMQSFTLYFCFPPQAFITQGDISKQCLWKPRSKSSQPHFFIVFCLLVTSLQRRRYSKVIVMNIKSHALIINLKGQILRQCCETLSD